MNVTMWSIRLALAAYVAATAAWLARRDAPARALWTAGCGLYLVHVVAAFQFVHGWSHTAAYLETARQTAETVGMNWGGGIYFNYGYTLIWVADVAWWWWRGLAGYRARPQWITLAVQGFFAFMFFNGTVVFARGVIRWFGVIASIGLGAMAVYYHRRTEPAG
jgi:hypothetical protein